MAMVGAATPRGRANVGSALAALGGTIRRRCELVRRLGGAHHGERGANVAFESRPSQLVTILDSLPIAVMLRAAAGTLPHVNPAGERFVERLGLGVSHIAASPSSLLEHLRVIDERGRPYDTEDLPVVTALRDGSTQAATPGYPLPGGGWAWYAVRAVPLVLDDATTGTVVTCDDVTDRHDANDRVEVAERSLRRLFDHAPIGIAVIALDGRLLQVNTALCDLLGDDHTDVLNAGLDGFMHPDDQDGDWEGVTTSLSATDDMYRADRRLRHSSGAVLHTQLSVALVRDHDGTPLHFIAQFVDVSTRHALEQELRAAAVEDPLTGLANRRGLRTRLADAQHHQARHGGEVGLLYLDLNDFKLINDNYGHDIGDRVLVDTGQRLLAATRDVNTVCRLGGDEFIVLCAPLRGADEFVHLVERIASMPPSTVVVDGHPLAVGQSVGSVIVEPHEDLDAALHRADTAMYQAKRRTATTTGH